MCDVLTGRNASFVILQSFTATD